METTSGSPESGSSSSRILTMRNLAFLGLRGSPQTGSILLHPHTHTQTLHVHRRVEFQLGSPCEWGRLNHEGHVVSGVVQDVHQHLGSQGSPARCKTLSDPPKEPKSVPVFTIVSYIRKQGGTHSPVLCRMIWEFLQFCHCENIILGLRHIPGKHNLLADTLSRSNKLVSTEWTLHMNIVQAVRDLWGSPTIDLFATKLNNRLPQYMSPLPDPKALAVNTLAVSWDGMNAYAFPPIPLI
jgi:hypothetical protein